MLRAGLWRQPKINSVQSAPRSAQSFTALSPGRSCSTSCILKTSYEENQSGFKFEREEMASLLLRNES